MIRADSFLHCLHLTEMKKSIANVSIVFEVEFSHAVQVLFVEKKKKRKPDI